MVISKTYNVGAHDSFIAYSTASKPKWVTRASASTVGGNAELPSGHRRLICINGADARTEYDCYVNPIALGSTNASWRAVIYASNGSYITSSGSRDIPTIGTPQVRIGVNAPSKAVVKYPVMKDNPMNVLGSSFAKWSDGHTGPIERGMEMTVEFRDKATGSMKTVFRGMIYQIESGETVTVTAYDRLMDLAQYSDQYQSHAGYTQNDTSKSRATSGSNYVYTMNNNVGALITATSEDMLKIDALADLGHTNQEHTFPRYIVHPLPSINGVSPQQGKKITNVKITLFSYLRGNRMNNQASTQCTQTCLVGIYLYQMVNGNLEQKQSVDGGSWTCTVSATNTSVVSNTATYTVNKAVDWTVEGDPSTYYIGVRVTFLTIGIGWVNVVSTAYADYTNTKRTFTGNFYTSDDGTTWTPVASGDHPEVAVTFEHSGQSVNVSSFTVSGNKLTIAQSAIPTPTVSGYLTWVDKGIRIIVSYFVSGAAGIREIVTDLVGWAGLIPDVVNDNMGQTSYYANTTYDFMTCIQEVLKNGNYAIFASINEAGKAYVRPRHTISETPVVTFSTDPGDYGTYDMGVVSHNLTAHWMAEKATQAYIAEDATTSGLPIALETDDALLPNSLVNIMQSPLRSIIADRSLGTHALMANAAGGKMVQLHTNVFEGTMVLAGYRLDVWDFNTGYAGGNPIGIRVPEYGAQGTAVPTEIIIGDGVTQVSLNNIRTADRSEVANSMGLSADANNNSASAIPETVYIFARLEDGNTYSTPSSVSNVKLYDEDGVVATQSTQAYIKIIEDNVGYTHIVAVFPASDKPSGYAPSKPIIYVSATWGTTDITAIFDNPKYAYDGQNVHVDLRFKRT